MERAGEKTASDVSSGGGLSSGGDLGWSGAAGEIVGNHSKTGRRRVVGEIICCSEECEE